MVNDCVNIQIKDTYCAHMITFTVMGSSYRKKWPWFMLGKSSR